MKNLLTSLTVFLLVMIGSVTKAQENAYQAKLDQVFKAFNTKDYALLKPLVDEKVLIDLKIPVGLNDAVLPQIIAQLPTPDSYRVIKSEKIDGGTRFTTEYLYKEKTRLQYFTFNSKGVITHLDILRDASKVEATMNTN